MNGKTKYKGIVIVGILLPLLVLSCQDSSQNSYVEDKTGHDVANELNAGDANNQTVVTTDQDVAERLNVEDSNKDPYKKLRDSRKRQHNYDNWSDRVSSEESFHIEETTIAGIKVGGLSLSEYSSTKLANRLDRTYLMKSDGSDRSMEGLFGKLVISECSSVKEAHECIIDYMITCTLPKFPSGKSRGIEVGDVCFTSIDDPPTGIIFARNNVMVSVRLSIEGLKQPLDQYKDLHEKVAGIVKEIANAIDEILST
jgi:hypothetical protein